ncbi:hypothetical protein GPJ56_004909 [Histomonas meleagridis]|uniref:uncharacterized protein n=1 Tax=Histomonas meleagridis TaxID=135588 RepID=UPI00355A63C3|nr:hypothetical protein GPJ56_004909 [Histomonas meleagridis]KAH0806297.1 hypothetical protein GO595_000985 [Histomonas meleagridis]
MNLGFSLLTKLGLSQEEADQHKNDKPSDAITVYAKDQTGIGYAENKFDFVLETDATFAKLQASRVGVEEINSTQKMEVKPPQQRFFIPTRLKKKPLHSLSTEDLAVILAKPEPVAVPVETIINEDSKPHKKRRKHHRKEQAEGKEEENKAD